MSARARMCVCVKDCCRFVAAVKNDLVTKMLVNMSIYSSVNYMHEPKQTHQFQCTMPMIIGLMEMNRTPMTQRIITLNLLLTKLNQFALLLCASVCVFFSFRCFWKIRFNANTVFNRFFIHYCCFCCYWRLCWCHGITDSDLDCVAIGGVFGALFHIVKSDFDFGEWKLWAKRKIAWQPAFAIVM